MGEKATLFQTNRLAPFSCVGFATTAELLEGGAAWLNSEYFGQLVGPAQSSLLPCLGHVFLRIEPRSLLAPKMGEPQLRIQNWFHPQHTRKSSWTFHLPIQVGHRLRSLGGGRHRIRPGEVRQAFADPLAVAFAFDRCSTRGLGPPKLPMPRVDVDFVRLSLRLFIWTYIAR